VNKKDNVQELTYTIVTTPLLVAFFALVLMSFGARSGNQCQLLTVLIIIIIIITPTISYML